MSEKEKPGEKTIARNKRARFDYELGERYEAGIALLGSEAKALRERSADLGESFCVIVKGEALLEGVNIPEIAHAAFGHKAKRTRKLLLHKVEIAALERAIARDGMTIVPTRLYFKEGRVKVELSVAKGLKKGDRREAVREREAEREARAAIGRGRKGL